MASDLSIRQAAISHMERGQRRPSFELLQALCEYFDVRADYLVDDSKSVLPDMPDRWSLRAQLASVGMWVEAPKEDLIDLEDGRVLCPLRAADSFYDEEAKRARQEGDAVRAREQRCTTGAELEAQLQAELAGYNVRRGRKRPLRT